MTRLPMMAKKFKLIKILFTNIFILLFFTSIVNSKITYVEKQVTGIGENYKMALRDAIREAISQVNGVTQETNSLIKTIEKTIFFGCRYTKSTRFFQCFQGRMPHNIYVDLLEFTGFY